MTREQDEDMAAKVGICEIYDELMASGIGKEDLQAATIAALWRGLEIASEGMSKDALKRLVFGEQPAPQPVASCRHQWTDESPANSWRSSCRLCGAQQAGSGQ